jgi:Na+/H+ antiporter NhaD/arsenite permease-like protein
MKASATSFRTFFNNSAPFPLLTGVLIGALVFSFITKTDLVASANSLPWSVLVIALAMDLFTGLVIATGVMTFWTKRLVSISKGRLLLILVLFGWLVFGVSTLLNNLTTIFSVVPIAFLLFRVLQPDQRFCNIFLGVVLATSNLGGAATPIGDFPAILIMQSGIVDFPTYLGMAFPPCFATTAVLLGVYSFLFWKRKNKRSADTAAERELACACLLEKYKYARVRTSALVRLGIAFIAMFAMWTFVPADVLPIHLTAVLGLALAALLVAADGIVPDIHAVNIKPLLVLGAYLFAASIVAETGLLKALAAWLQTTITNPVALLIAVMVISSLIAALLGAGPAAAAMLPVIHSLAQSSLSQSKPVLAVSFALAICAGSSAFMWSATAGFLLSEKVSDARLMCTAGPVRWGVAEYLRFGLLNYTLQLGMAIGWTLLNL